MPKGFKPASAQQRMLWGCWTGCHGAFLGPCSYFNLNASTSELFRLGFCVQFHCRYMKCAQLGPVPLPSVHWRRKGSLHEQSTLLPDHAASLGHKRDFSLTPQKETNGTRKNSFPPKVLPESEPVAWEGPDGCLSTGCHI